MPSIDKLIPRYLNMDDDERLVKNVEMTDAQNIRISVDVERDALVIKNAYGNIARSSTLENGAMPAGTNVAIGSVADETTNQIYFAVFNSNAEHLIIRYDANGKKAYKVYQDSVLQFSQNSYVQMSVVRNSNTEILLYLNDSLTPPKKINATKAEQSVTGNGGYPSPFLNGTDEEKLLYITVAKQPPLAPPSISFANNPAYPQNDIFEKNFQFAYQYEYMDGEQSALSPYSELSVTSFQLKDGFINNADRYTYNQINVTVNNSKGDVSKIKVYARRGDRDAPFFLIGTLLNNVATGTQVLNFRDDQSFIPLSAEVQDKRYDNVPQVADSQAICSSRLFYGGYTEGYPNLSVEGTSVTPNYNEKPTVYDLSVAFVANPASAYDDDETLQNRYFSIDYSGLPASVSADSSIFLSFSWDDGFTVLKNRLGDNNNYNFFSGSGGASINVSPNVSGPSNQLEAISGMRIPASNTGGTPGPDANGPLNCPPTIRFIKQKNTSETEDAQVPINHIIGGIKLLTSGIQIRERVNIPAGSSRARMIALVEQRICKLYPFLANSQPGNGGFSRFTTGGDTPGTTESAAFKGKGYARVLPEANGATSVLKVYKVLIDSLTISIDKFVFGTKQADVVEPESPTAQFDFIEGPSNSKGQNNRIIIDDFVSNGRGQLVKINAGFQQNDNRDGQVLRTNASVTQAGCFLIANAKMDGHQCFKSGSMHQLGIVYFDDRGRAGGVQKVGAADILHTNNRSTQNNLDGYANVVMRIKHTPPVWAKRYAPVYAGRGSIINKVQYSVGGAYLAFNDKSNQGSFGANQSIYLSLNTLQGKENSYTNQFGALIEYGFAAGDKVRIVRYGNNEKSQYVFKVVKTVNLIDDQLINPLLDRSSLAAIQNTTGTFLVIEDNSIAEGFNSKSIIEGDTNWNDDCVIEIYRENKAFDTKLYYEIGTSLGITAGVHNSERTTLTTSVKLTAQSGNSVTGYAVAQIYKGDIIQDGTGKQITVGNVTPSTAESGFNYLFYGTTVANFTIPSTANFTVTNPDAVLLLNNGDSYYRLRTLLTGAGATNQNIVSNVRIAFAQNNIVDFVEDYRVSDFYDSDYQSLGRTFPYLPDARTYKRTGSITWSDPFNIENTTLGLSSFNMTKINYKDLAYDYGSIRSLVPYNELMYVLHERRTGVLPVGRNVITADTGEALVASNLILGPPRYYTGEFGINNNPESVASYRGYVFFVDAISAKVCRLGFESGLEVISEQLVDSFFEDSMYSAETTATNRRYIGGVDKENTEYIISAAPLYTSEITVDDTLTGNQIAGFGRTDSGSTVIDATPVYDDSLTFNFESDPRDFDVNQDEFDTSGAGLLIIDQLTNTPIIAMAESYSPAYQNGSLNTAVPVTVTSSSFDAFMPGLFNQESTESTLDDSLESTGTITNTTQTLPGFTIAYDIRGNYWSTRYSYIAEQILSLSDALYTFKNGIIYEHNPNVARNTFYGVAAPSIVEVISNFNPSMIKVYEAISLEGNSDDWSCTMNNSTQTSAIASSIWQDKEGFYYAPIHQDSSMGAISTTSTANITSVDGTSQFFSLGVVDSASGSVINFKNAINNIPFPVGSTTALYRLNSSSNRLEPLGYRADSKSGEKQITCNATTSGLIQNDVVVLVATPSIEGDAMRDYYLQVTLTNSLTTPHELYAINLIYAKSNLHNQQGQ
jgi:hypothetical protein